MRRLFLLCLICCVAGPARADVTAHYRSDAMEGMVVYLADNGDLLIDHGSNTAYLTTGGQTYLILSDARGTFTTRRETFLAVLQELTAVTLPPTRPERYSILDNGEETVAGYRGRRFSVGTEGSRQDRMDVVVSSAPELQDLGRAVAGHIVPWFAIMPGSAAAMAETLRDVLARGAVVRLGPLFVLERIDRTPIPADRLWLPSPPLDRQALTARLQETIDR